MRATDLYLATAIALLAPACDTDGANPTQQLDAGRREVDAATALDGTPGFTEPQEEGGRATNVRLPMPNGAFDYQLGGAYAPADRVAIVSRDKGDAPAPLLYNICYVNGFQTQPEERDFWLSEHPELILRDAAGKEIIDPDWDELLLDLSTPKSRTALLAIVRPWIDGCKQAGFDAVEVDNLDSYARSKGRLTEEHAVLYMRMLADAAHAQGLAVAQKNASELLLRRTEMGTDFAIVEECNFTSECAEYIAAYGDQVFVIEYQRTAFERGCRNYPNLSIVYRDLELVTPGERGYVYEGC